MGLLTRKPLPPPPQQRAQVTAALAGVQMPVPWPGSVPTREAAWCIPAVAAGIQTIQTIAGFDLYRERVSDLARDEIPITQRIDPNEPLAHTLGKAVEDLVLFGRVYFRVLHRDWLGRPDALMYYPYEYVHEPGDSEHVPRTSQPVVGVYDFAGESVNWSDVHVWEGHWDGLLVAGAASIFAAQDWADAASRLAKVETPSGVLKNEGADLSPDEIDALLDHWESARASRTTAYLNATLNFEGQRFDAEQLALVDARNYQVAEVARLLNIPPGSGGMNPPVASSLTYRNVQESRRDLVDIALAPYLHTIEGQMGQLVNSQHRVRVNLDAFLRADTKTLAEVAAVGLKAGFMTVEEVRRSLGLPDEPWGELREPQETSLAEVQGDIAQQTSEQEG